MGITRKEESTPAVKKERKKPVRKAPVQKDYPNKLAWLKAMTTYEEAQTQTTNVAKVSRLNKRIKTKKATIATLAAELRTLEQERDVLVPVKAETAAPQS